MNRITAKAALSLLLICVLMLQLIGCAGAVPGIASGNAGTEEPESRDPLPGGAIVNLMAEIKAAPSQPAPVSREAAAAAADFALRLLRAGCKPEENVLLSPLSVLCALAMTENGAEGETLEQMERTLGMPREQWNAYFLSYLAGISGDGALKPANSIWFTDDPRFTVNRDFLQTNADFYGADVYRAPFSDPQTLADINGWVKEKTDGMIPTILDEIPAAAVMYLINALAFEAKWASPYQEGSVISGEFTCADGSTRTVDFMHSEEGLYLENETLMGFLKPYKDGKYAFAALLPKNGAKPEDCLGSLDGAALQKLLAEPQSGTVIASLPKFETAYSAELSEMLASMGMVLPFDSRGADFSGLGSSNVGNIFISRVLHKTFLSVAEDGTRAGAATAVEASDECYIEPLAQVCLDRPFLYMLVDLETGLPFFIGVMQDPAQ